MRFRYLLIFIFCSTISSAQTLGGNAVFNFLKLPPSARLSAWGGVGVSHSGGDAGLTAQQPALLHPRLDQQLNLTFTPVPGGISGYALTGVRHNEKRETTFGGHIHFMNYGSMPQTDASGNGNGNFHPVDFVVQGSASRSYGERWRYGAAVKFIQSSYGLYRSNALAMDIGLHYADSAHGFEAGLVAKNMGVQLQTYAGEREDLPFDLQVGITKRLAAAPFAFSLTAQQLHRFHITYNDTAFNNENEFSSSSGFANKLLNHFVVAAHVYLGQQLEAAVGYNHLRRSELNMANGGNGLNGFSVGMFLRLSRLDVQLARSHYGRNIAYNQIGLTLRLDRLFGLGSQF